MATVLRTGGGDGPGSQRLPEVFAALEVVGGAGVPGTAHPDVELRHVLLAVAALSVGGIGLVFTKVQPGQGGAVGPPVDHVPPVAVAAGFRQAAVEVAQGTGALFKARRVVQQEDRAQTALHIGGQLGGARHGQVGRALSLGLLVGIVQRIDVQGHDHLAVAVPVFAELGKLSLERVHSILRQVVGGHHGHIVVGLGGKEILPDKVVRHKGHGDADEDHPLQVIIPPVGPAFFPGILFFPAGFEVAGLDVAFVTIACHSSP